MSRSGSVFINWDILRDVLLKQSAAVDLYNRAKQGEWGKAFTSDLCVHKAIILLVVQGKVLEAAVLVKSLIGGTEPGDKNQGQLLAEITTLPPLKRPELENAKKLFLEHYNETNMDLVDWASVIYMNKRKIQTIVTLDDKFTRLGMLKEPRILSISVTKTTESGGHPRNTSYKAPSRWIFTPGIGVLSLIPAFAALSNTHVLSVPNEAYAAPIVAGIGLLGWASRRYWGRREPILAKGDEE